jgi:hypothetical protein
MKQAPALWLIVILRPTVTNFLELAFAGQRTVSGWKAKLELELNPDRQSILPAITVRVHPVPNLALPFRFYK